MKMLWKFMWIFSKRFWKYLEISFFSVISRLVDETSIKIDIQQDLLNFRFTSFRSVVSCLVNFVFKTFQFIFFPKSTFECDFWFTDFCVKNLLSSIDKVQKLRKFKWKIRKSHLKQARKVEISLPTLWNFPDFYTKA